MKLPLPAFLSEKPQKREAPCQKHRRKILEALEPLREKSPEEYLFSLGREAVKSHWLWVTEIQGIDFFDPWLHGEEIFRFVDDNLGRCFMILTPRGSGKTTGVTVPLPTRILAESRLSTALICNAREDKAAKMARSAANAITRNKKYQLCFPGVKPSVKWGENGYYLDIGDEDDEDNSGGAFTFDRVDPSIGSYGTTSNIVGAHISGLILHDDLINKEIARHPNQVRSVEEFFRESLNCLDPGATMCVIGTRWTYFDFYGKLLSGEIVATDGQPFNILKLGVTRPDGSIIWPRRKFVDMSGKTREIGYSEEFILAQKKIQGKLFSALYYNEPVLDDDRQFDLAKIKTFKYQPPFDVGPAIAVGIEVGTAQGAALKYPILELKRREHRKFRVEELHRGNRVTKHDAIRGTLQPLISDYRLNIRDDLFRDNIPGLGQEFRDFDKGSDDCLDALEHAISMAKDPPEGQNPYVYIACDPAFSLDGDATAICAVCRYEGEVWILDSDRFFSDRVDNIIRRLVRMYDKWCGGKLRAGKKFGIKTSGVMSSAHPSFGKSSSEQSIVYSQDIFWGDRVHEANRQVERELPGGEGEQGGDTEGY